MLPPIHLLDFVVRIETVRVGAIVHLVAGRIIGRSTLDPLILRRSLPD